jgi:hypothetical protein
MYLEDGETYLTTGPTSINLPRLSSPMKDRVYELGSYDSPARNFTGIK